MCVGEWLGLVCLGAMHFIERVCRRAALYESAMECLSIASRRVFCSVRRVSLPLIARGRDACTALSVLYVLYILYYTVHMFEADWTLVFLSK